MYDRNDWRRDRCMVYATFEGTEIADVIRDLVNTSTLQGIGLPEHEEILLRMAESYALEASNAIQKVYGPEDQRITLMTLRHLREHDALPDEILRNIEY